MVRCRTLTYVVVVSLSGPRPWLFDALATVENEEDDDANEDHANHESGDDENELPIDRDQC